MCTCVVRVCIKTPKTSKGTDFCTKVYDCVRSVVVLQYTYMQYIHIDHPCPQEEYSSSTVLKYHDVFCFVYFAFE